MATLAVYRMFVHKRGEPQLGLEKARPHSKQHSKQSATRHAHGLKTVDELIWWLALLFFFFLYQQFITRGAMAGRSNYLVATIH